jgi:hypothetical protein
VSAIALFKSFLLGKRSEGRIEAEILFCFAKKIRANNSVLRFFKRKMRPKYG